MSGQISGSSSAKRRPNTGSSSSKQGGRRLLRELSQNEPARARVASKLKFCSEGTLKSGPLTKGYVQPRLEGQSGTTIPKHSGSSSSAVFTPSTLHYGQNDSLAKGYSSPRRTVGLQSQTELGVFTANKHSLVNGNGETPPKPDTPAEKSQVDTKCCSSSHQFSDSDSGLPISDHNSSPHQQEEPIAGPMDFSTPTQLLEKGYQATLSPVEMPSPRDLTDRREKTRGRGSILNFLCTDKSVGRRALHQGDSQHPYLASTCSQPSNSLVSDGSHLQPMPARSSPGLVTPANQKHHDLVPATEFPATEFSLHKDVSLDLPVSKDSSLCSDFSPVNSASPSVAKPSSLGRGRLLQSLIPVTTSTCSPDGLNVSNVTPPAKDSVMSAITSTSPDTCATINSVTSVLSTSIHSPGTGAMNSKSDIISDTNATKNSIMSSSTHSLDTSDSIISLTPKVTVSDNRAEGFASPKSISPLSRSTKRRYSNRFNICAVFSSPATTPSPTPPPPPPPVRPLVSPPPPPPLPSPPTSPSIPAPLVSPPPPPPPPTLPSPSTSPFPISIPAPLVSPPPPPPLPSPPTSPFPISIPAPLVSPPPPFISTPSPISTPIPLISPPPEFASPHTSPPPLLFVSSSPLPPPPPPPPKLADFTSYPAEYECSKTKDLSLPALPTPSPSIATTDSPPLSNQPTVSPSLLKAPSPEPMSVVPVRPLSGRSNQDGPQRPSRNKDEVEQRIAAMQRSIHCRQVELKRVQSKNEAMAKEFTSELQEMEKDPVGAVCYLPPHKIKAFDGLLRMNAKAVMAAERIRVSEGIRENFRKKSYVKLGSDKLAKMELDLLLKEDGCKEKVAAAKAQTNLLQRKLDFYVNDV